MAELGESITHLSEMYVERVNAVALSLDPIPQEALLQKANEIAIAIDQQEKKLSLAETQSSDQKAWEGQLLALNKRFQRINSSITGSSMPEPFQNAAMEMGNAELVQLQDILIDKQDRQLDSLSSLISKQKEIGQLISNELDMQLDLLEEADIHAERTTANMSYVQNNMNKLLNANDNG
jgi:hypothetical protein